MMNREQFKKDPCEVLQFSLRLVWYWCSWTVTVVEGDLWTFRSIFVSAAAYSAHWTEGECKHWRNLLYWLEFICTSTIDSLLCKTVHSLRKVWALCESMDQIDRNPFYRSLQTAAAFLGLLLWSNIGNPSSFTVKFLEMQKRNISLPSLNLRC